MARAHVVLRCMQQSGSSPGEVTDHQLPDADDIHVTFVILRGNGQVDFCTDEDVGTSDFLLGRLREYRPTTS